MIDIEWTNNFSPNGYGICGRRYVEILVNLGYNVKINPQPYLPKKDPLYPLIKTKVQNPLKVWHGIPSIPKEAYYTVTEVREPPDYMAYHLKHSKFIMTQSTFCKESFSRVTNSEKIHVVNFPFFEYEFNPRGRRFKLQIDKEYKFKFLTVARYDIRKNLNTLMEAFAEEFGDSDEVCLVLKMGSDRYCLPKIFYELDLPKNIYWMRTFVNDMSALYRSFDSYVATDNGEGWGAPTTEAMLCGLPTIAPRHSGHLDYMNDENSFLIDVGDWEYIGHRRDNLYSDLLQPQSQWKQPIYEDIKRKMRQVYETFKDMPKKERLEMDVIKNALKVQEIVSEEYVGKQIKSAMDWYERNYGK